jgi:hypothetical protein
LRSGFICSANGTGLMPFGLAPGQPGIVLGEQEEQHRGDRQADRPETRHAMPAVGHHHHRRK